jgi:hypothetical protein
LNIYIAIITDVPDLFQRLRELASKQGELQANQTVFHDELKSFLSIYTNTVTFSTLFFYFDQKSFLFSNEF